MDKLERVPLRPDQIDVVKETRRNIPGVLAPRRFNVVNTRRVTPLPFLAFLFFVSALTLLDSEPFFFKPHVFDRLNVASLIKILKQRERLIV